MLPVSVSTSTSAPLTPMLQKATGLGDRPVLTSAAMLFGTVNAPTPIIGPPMPL